MKTDLDYLRSALTLLLDECRPVSYRNDWEEMKEFTEISMLAEVLIAWKKAEKKEENNEQMLSMWL